MQWVLRAQCHDRDALEALLRSVQSALRRYLTGLTSVGDADDLLQDVFVIIVRRIGTLDDPKLFRPWAYRIASREAFRHLKKRRLWHERHEPDVPLDDLPGSDRPPSGELIAQLLASGTLSPASRAVLSLHFQEDLSLPDVAAILGIPLGTAKSRLAYGLRSLRKHFDPSGECHE